MRFRIDLLLEGVPTVDRRLIRPGATQVPPERPLRGPCPLFWWDDRWASYEQKLPVGAIDVLERVGSAVVAEAHLFPNLPTFELTDWYREGSLLLEADLHLVDALWAHGQILIDRCSILGARVVGGDVGRPCWLDLAGSFVALP